MIPTLAADSALLSALRSLEAQTFRNFNVIVVDNSGKRAVRALGVQSNERLTVIENARNEGFGGAINQGWHASGAPYIATLNDDAEACPGWLEAMIEAAGKDERIGLVACQVRLSDRELDSAGMLICGDGSSRQRGHLQSPECCSREEDVLMPSGSAALYRREMLEDTGGFAAEFFLYCEDSDLGLRALWRGWRCVYTPKAVVMHGYSRTAGRASALKAWLVERNRLRLLVRNFPFRLLWKAPFVALARYVWHVVYMLRGQGKAAEFAQASAGSQLPLLVLKAHWDAFRSLPALLTQRQAIRKTASLDAGSFVRVLRRHSMTARQVAAL